MPATETVAPGQGATTENVADGLRQIADLLDRMWDVRLGPHKDQAPVHADLKVADMPSVEAFAMIFGTPVNTSRVGPVIVAKTASVYEGVHLTVHAVIHEASILRRDPNVTSELAERDV